MSGFNQTESKPLLVIFHLEASRNWEVQAYFGDIHFQATTKKRISQ